MTEGGCAGSPFSPYDHKEPTNNHPQSLPTKQLLREGLQRGFPKEHTTTRLWTAVKTVQVMKYCSFNAAGTRGDKNSTSCVTSAVAGERGAVGVGQLKKMSRFCCHCTGGKCHDGMRQHLVLLKQSRVPAEALHKRSFFHVPVDVLGPNWQTLCGEEKILLFLLFL